MTVAAKGYIILFGLVICVLGACSSTPTSEKEGCAYLHFMAAAVQEGLDVHGGLEKAERAYELLDQTAPPRSLKEDTSEDAKNLLAYVTSYRAQALGAMDAVRHRLPAHVSELQDGARAVWDGRDCGSATGYSRWDKTD